MSKKSNNLARVVRLGASIALSIGFGFASINGAVAQKAISGKNAKQIGVQITNSARTQQSGGHSIVVVNQKLKQLLEEFASQHAITLTISEKVRNTSVRSKRYSIEVEKFLDQISTDFSLDWYQRGGEYFVSSINERSSRMIGLSNISYNRVNIELANLVSNTQGFSFEEVTTSNSIFISGPPTFVALAELMVEGMIKNGQVASNNVTVYRFGVKTSAETVEEN